MAVINRTGVCIFKKMCPVHSIILVLVLFGAGFSFASQRSCDLVKTDIQQILKLHIGYLDQPETGELCDVSCCSRDVEKNLYKNNQIALNHYVRNSIVKISSIIDTRAKKFDDCFRGMMNTSKREFHEMFERTYGKIYLKNSDVFSDFFGELETYYKKGTVRLSETMDTFFGILYQRMFTVINAQYTFDEKYLECVSEHMAEMKPFGDVPKKLGIQLRRSFVGTRTFYKSLTKSVEVANRLSALGIDNKCYRESAKMRYCGICKGLEAAGPCTNYCTGTMHYCLRYHMDVSQHWDNLVDAIDKVGERLLGPYNIEQVVEPLNIKISEAIMNFQESSGEVSKKIYTKCGKPAFNRPKRRADYKSTPKENPNMEIETRAVKLAGKKKHKKIIETNDTKSILEKLIIEIRQKIKETKQFWMQLPYQFCNNLSISHNFTDGDQCWNGTGNHYDVSPPPLVISDSAIVNEQIYILKGLTDKLRKAHQGQEVEMVDDTEESLVGSGSGSGDTSLDTEEGGEAEEEVEEEERSKDIIFDNGDNEKEFFTTPPVVSSTNPPEVVHTSAANTNNMSLTRALIQYLLPIVLVWFGGAITNLL